MKLSKNKLKCPFKNEHERGVLAQISLNPAKHCLEDTPQTKRFRKNDMTSIYLHLPKLLPRN